MEFLLHFKRHYLLDLSVTFAGVIAGAITGVFVGLLSFGSVYVVHDSATMHVLVLINQSLAHFFTRH
jgi:hypothetical protein